MVYIEGEIAVREYITERELVLPTKVKPISYIFNGGRADESVSVCMGRKEEGYIYTKIAFANIYHCDVHYEA